METDNQQDISKVPVQLQPHVFKKGQSGNLAGRPKGVTLKEYARDFLAKMNDEERQEFMEGIPKEVIWKMAEGNPVNELTGKDGKDLFPDNEAREKSQLAVNEFLNVENTGDTE